MSLPNTTALAKEIPLASGLTLGEGWNELEFDGERVFRWSSGSSLLKIDKGSFAKDGLLMLYLGNPVSGEGRHILVGGSRNKMSLRLVSGWNYYLFSTREIMGQEDRCICLEVDAPLALATEKRALGAMVASVGIVEAPKGYSLPAIFTTCIVSGDFTIFARKDQGTKGVLGVSKDALLRSKGDFLYLDLVYEAQGSQAYPIEFKISRYSLTPQVLYGGLRLFALQIPLSLVKENQSIEFETKAHIEFKECLLRDGYYDFLGLKTRARQDPDYQAREDSLCLASRKDGLSIRWFVTWRCPFRCPYCWQEAQAPLYRGSTAGDETIPAELWAKKLNALNPQRINFTGGEPFAYKDLLRVIELLDRRITLTISTNLSRLFDPEAFSRRIAPRRFAAIVFSFHPTQDSPDNFFNRLEFLAKAKIRNLAVEMVLAPQNLPFAELLLRKCKALNIPLALDPCVTEDKNPIYAEPGYIEMVGQYREAAQAQNKSLKRRTFEIFTSKAEGLLGFLRGAGHSSDFGKIPILCQAGSNSITLDYKGDAYVCMSAIDRSRRFGRYSLPHYLPIGNIFDERFRLLEKPLVCWESFRCSACDYGELALRWEKVFKDSDEAIQILPE